MTPAEAKAFLKTREADAFLSSPEWEAVYADGSGLVWEILRTEAGTEALAKWRATGARSSLPSTSRDSSTDPASWEAVWGDVGITQGQGGGVLAASNFFIRYHWVLGINSKEAMLILKVMTHKWGAGHPYLLNSTLADYLGEVNVRQVRKTMKSLEKRGFLRRIYRKDEATELNRSNVYDLTLLFARIRSLMDSPELLEQEKATYRAKKDVRAAKTRKTTLSKQGITLVAAGK